MSWQLITSCATDALPAIAGGSVQCVATSPPYFCQRGYGVDGQVGREGTPREYADKLVGIFREVRRVLHPTGTCWLVIGDSYAANRSYQCPSTKGGPKHSPAQAAGGSCKVPDGLKPKDMIGIPWRVAFALQEDGWYLRSDIIWEKPNCMPSSVKDRPTTSHEYVFLLTKSPKYYYDYKAVEEPAVGTKGGSCFGKVRLQAGAEETGAQARRYERPVYTTRNGRTVWSIPTKSYHGAHFAVFPEALVEKCLMAGTKPGDAVLDPFAGSGTTMLVAERMGRNSIGIELNADYRKIINERMGIADDCHQAT